MIYTSYVHTYVCAKTIDHECTQLPTWYSCDGRVVILQNIEISMQPTISMSYNIYHVCFKENDANWNPMTRTETLNHMQSRENHENRLKLPQSICDMVPSWFFSIPEWQVDLFHWLRCLSCLSSVCALQFHQSQVGVYWTMRWSWRNSFDRTSGPTSLILRLSVVDSPRS